MSEEKSSTKFLTLSHIELAQDVFDAAAKLKALVAELEGLNETWAEGKFSKAKTLSFPGIYNLSLPPEDIVEFLKLVQEKLKKRVQDAEVALEEALTTYHASKKNQA